MLHRIHKAVVVAGAKDYRLKASLLRLGLVWACKGNDAFKSTGVSAPPHHQLFLVCYLSVQQSHPLQPAVRVLLAPKIPPCRARWGNNGLKPHYD